VPRPCAPAVRDRCCCGPARSRNDDLCAPGPNGGAAVRGAMSTRFLLGVFLPLAAAHSNLITPKPRNAIDSELPEWKDGKSPYMWVPNIGKVWQSSALAAAAAVPHPPRTTDTRPTCACPCRLALRAHAGTAPACAPQLRRACGSRWAAPLGARSVSPSPPPPLECHPLQRAAPRSRVLPRAHTHTQLPTLDLLCMVQASRRLTEPRLSPTGDGGDKGPANPNRHDRCGSGMNATINDARYRTVNRFAEAGSDADWTKFNPWRAPGTTSSQSHASQSHAPRPTLAVSPKTICHHTSLVKFAPGHAPVYDPCGRASGSYKATPGKGEFTNTTYAKLGDLGSQVLPKYDTGAVWEAGSVVETMINFRATHGGGYQYRLCPLEANLTEECMQRTPMAFAGNSRLMIWNGSIVELDSVDVSDGTLPVGGTWRVAGIPYIDGYNKTNPWAFPPPCDEPGYPHHAPKDWEMGGHCSGVWTNNITMYDYLRVPQHLKPGQYVLGFRWDCESSAQVRRLVLSCVPRVHAVL
jgi:hypothetical protein